MSKSFSATNSSCAADAGLNVRPITPAIGAEIHGVRLSGNLPAETVTAIRDALLRHRVVFFRGQGHLDEVGHQAFARSWGRWFATRRCPRLPAPKRSSISTPSTPGRTAGTRT